MDKNGHVDEKCSGSHSKETWTHYSRISLCMKVRDPWKKSSSLYLDCKKTSSSYLKKLFKTRRVCPLTAILFQTIVGGFIRGRKVRTPQGTVAANGCPPRGEDQSNRDEPALGSVETGNLYGEQHQIGSLWFGPDRLRVDGLRRRASAVLDE